MIEYAIQIDWKSEYDPRSFSYDVCRLYSLLPLNHKQLLDRITSPLIKEQIQERFIFTSLRIMETEKELSRSRNILCKDEKYSCGIFVRNKNIVS